MVADASLDFSVLSLISAGFVLAVPVTVELSSGSSIRGEILSESAEKVVLDLDTRWLVFRVMRCPV